MTSRKGGGKEIGQKEEMDSKLEGLFVLLLDSFADVLLLDERSLSDQF